MKKNIILGLISIVSGIFLTVNSYNLGMKYIDCGCGCCGGTTSFPNYATSILFSPPKIINPSPELCATLGCAFPKIPIFVDIYFTSGILIVLGMMILFKNLKLKK